MTRNEAWVKIGSALAVTMMSYLILNSVTNGMTPLWKAIVICFVAVVAIIIAFWGGRRPSQKKKQAAGTTIGTKITAKGDVVLESIDVGGSPNEDVEVGSDISTDKDVRIKDVHVNYQGPKNGKAPNTDD